jgi:hypothetical protein
MVRSNHYYFLVASLPPMPRHFEVDRVPITRPRLEKRLELLNPRDAEVVEQLREFLLWDRQPWDRTDEEVVAHFHELMSTTANRLARHILAYQMDVRVILSGLRRRRRGLPPPPEVGTWGGLIRDNWEHPEFKLHWEHPWIAEVAPWLDTTNSLQVERIKLRVVWDHWAKLAEQYFFSFEAVLLYLVRWEIIKRWTSRDAALGRRRFEQLVTESLDEYAHLYE